MADTVDVVKGLQAIENRLRRIEEKVNDMVYNQKQGFHLGEISHGDWRLRILDMQLQSISILEDIARTLKNEGPTLGNRRT